MKLSVHTNKAIAGALALLLSGCASAFKMDAIPSADKVETPASFRDDAPGSGEFLLSPSWWESFHDPQLNNLIAQALERNRDLSAAAHRVDQARALAGQARAELFPQVSLEAQGGRRQGIDTAYQATEYVRIPALLSYEADLWGAVRRRGQAARAEADAEQFSYESATLSLSAQVAETFYLWRATKAEEEIVSATVDTRREARQVIAAQREQGSVGELDFSRAETELAIAEAELADVTLRRTQLANALAVLVGEAAPSFTLDDPSGIMPAPPSVPAGLPAKVLQNRPDIAAAERLLNASADRVGIARAAFYPNIQLTATGGWESGDFSDIISSDRQAWSIGPQIYLPIFQGGRRRAGLARARAAYEENGDAFATAVLLALAEVQDALSAGRLIAQRAEANERAVASARRSAALSRTRYEAGYVGYLEVVDSERVALSAERAQAQLDAQHLIAAIHLIKALGGGWNHPSGSGVAAAR